MLSGIVGISANGAPKKDWKNLGGSRVVSVGTY